MSACCLFIRRITASFCVLSPHISLCLPNIQISPGFEIGSSISSSASSKSKSSSFEPVMSFKILSTSSKLKPVMSISTSASFNSASNSSNLPLSHSPVILFKAIFNAFSLFLSRSTILHSISL